jgi:hypothetical protein
MARQKQWQKRAVYKVVGPAGREKNLKYVTHFRIEGGDEVIVFRFIRVKRKKQPHAKK